MTTVDPLTGFGDSLRGGGAICFGSKAVTNFLAQQDFSYIMRAHEAHAEGVAVSKGARVFTVFSTSQDHNQGEHAMAGCILVDNDKLQVINRSPAYRNQYVHRRDSVSLAALSETEIQKRIKLGLVTGQTEASEDDTEEWDDFDDGSDESKGEDAKAEYVFDNSRRSSVDMGGMCKNSHDETETEWESASDGSLSEFEPNKRQRAKPSISSIPEASAEDEDVDTVDGDDEDMELRDPDES